MGGVATEKALNKVIKSIVSTKAMITNGTAVEVVYVTSAANRPWHCPVRPGNCPGSKLVWRVYLHQSR
jgi:hypothetical protein